MCACVCECVCVYAGVQADMPKAETVFPPNTKLGSVLQTDQSRD